MVFVSIRFAVADDGIHCAFMEDISTHDIKVAKVTVAFSRNRQTADIVFQSEGSLGFIEFNDNIVCVISENINRSLPVRGQEIKLRN